ncbi:MAG: linear amide C-N hydrolase [Legionellaceae bacterium]|nr:linear amide C-N hydrolase [Legionellaceae bacterium]
MNKYLLIGCLLYATNSLACTHFCLTAEDKTVITGRSMEFGSNLETDIYSVNRDKEFSSESPDGKPGLKWRAKYGYLALDGLHLFPVSGLNEKGLSFDALYLPGLAEYEAYDSKRAAESMPYYYIADYILGNFATIDEVKKNLPKLNIYTKALQYAGQETVFPLHYVVTDKNSHSLVIEMVDGKLNLYDDPTGILTNSPSYPWHNANIQNYANLSKYAPLPITKDGITYAATWQGGGAVGLPGDYTPSARFVKVNFLVTNAKQMPDASGSVNLALHILNNVDIPYGVVRGEKGKEAPDTVDFTQWIVVKDLSHRALYYRTYNDLNLHKVDMNKIQFAPNSPPFKRPLVAKSKMFAFAANN